MAEDVSSTETATLPAVALTCGTVNAIAAEALLAARDYARKALAPETLRAYTADRVLDEARVAIGNTGAPELRLGAYEGPLGLLLALARAKRVDLARLSVTELSAQFTALPDSAIARPEVFGRGAAEPIRRAAGRRHHRTAVSLPAPARATGL